MAFHHGTETKRTDGGSSPVYDIDGAITALIGTAPMGAVNDLIVCQTVKDFAQFSALTYAGFTIPDAADIWTRYASGKCYVVNVCDPAKHRTIVASESLTVDPATLMATTAKPALIAGTYTVKDGTTALVENTAYTIDTVTGTIQFVTKPTTPTIAYTYVDPSKVTEAEVLGGYVLASNARTGLELIKEGFTRFGADAKVIIIPEYDKTATCAAAMISTALAINAEAYISAPKGTNLSASITGRGPAGTINFKSAEKPANYFYPYLKKGDVLEHKATHDAGLRMWVDVNEGYWFSTSNHEYRGVTGVEFALTSRIDDPQSETNRLNAVGINTVFNSFGTGLRAWGNRNASWPTNSHVSNFSCAYRTGNFIDEAIRRSQLKYIDRPIDEALLDAFVEDIRIYLSGCRAIVGFSVDLDRDYDLADAFSKGQVPIMYEFTPKLPAERISNNSVMTRKYMANLVSK